MVTLIKAEEDATQPVISIQREKYHSYQIENNQYIFFHSQFFFLRFRDTKYCDTIQQIDTFVWICKRPVQFHNEQHGKKCSIFFMHIYLTHYLRLFLVGFFCSAIWISNSCTFILKYDVHVESKYFDMRCNKLYYVHNIITIKMFNIKLISTHEIMCPLILGHWCQFSSGREWANSLSLSVVSLAPSPFILSTNAKNSCEMELPPNFFYFFSLNMCTIIRNIRNNAFGLMEYCPKQNMTVGRFIDYNMHRKPNNFAMQFIWPEWKTPIKCEEGERWNKIVQSPVNSGMNLNDFWLDVGKNTFGFWL